MAELLEPTSYGPIEPISGTVVEDTVCSRNRSGTFVAEVLKGLGVACIAVGLYGAVDNTVDIYTAKDALITDIGDFNSEPMEQAVSRLTSGTSQNGQEDFQIIAEGNVAIDRIVNTGVKAMVHQGSQATEGLQDIVIGSLLLAGGGSGLLVLGRRQKKQMAVQFEKPVWGTAPIVDEEKKTEPEASMLKRFRHATRRQIGRAAVRGVDATRWTAKAGLIGAGAAVVVSSVINPAAAESGDRTITKPIDSHVVEPAQEVVAEGGAKFFKNSFADEIEAAFAAKLPLTLEAIQSIPAFKAEYDKKVQESYEKVEQLAEVNPPPSFIKRMDNRFSDGRVSVAAVLASGAFLISRARTKRTDSTLV